MKKLFFFLLLISQDILATAQTSTSFDVGGDIDKFYPVTFKDVNWSVNKETEISIGRSNTHLNSGWRGSMISSFRFHTSNWGHGSAFISADLKSSQVFIAGWRDATAANPNSEIIIWLKGGGTTYVINSTATVGYTVYDGVQNALPFAELNGPEHTFKTTPDSYVPQNQQYLATGMVVNGDIYANGNVGIGTSTPNEKLAVNGKIRAREIKVEAANWPDYVFEKKYQIASLGELEKYIKINKHLPEMPGAKEVESNGVELGDLVKKLLKNQEELTLHLIAQEKTIKALEKKLTNQHSLKTKSKRK
ncbi:hypothetical protein QF042_001871 [Pedobacter sp. W3I1]|uniref:tail fiber protein n=1 Tax=Pedobacter sp. W3I1 TaxID=3042291 RepID=UPI002785CFEE|nr:tail fiber protein [Pedobacter sp. W3I1]MDQ0638306.1 hypothetical protein [Pedobacter sp. W3I1]